MSLPVFGRVVGAVLLAASEGASVEDAAGSWEWKTDAEGLVSANDVVYDTPSVEPWEAMPVGGGDLSAMVRCDGRELHLHLTKSDAWGFQAPADAPLGTRFFNNVSPGHVCLRLGEAATELSARRFRQRLDLYRGRVTIEIGDAGRTARVAVWGHPTRRILVVQVEDPHALLGLQAVELSEWRDSMEVGVSETRLTAREVHRRAAAPHMATSGMEDYFDDETDPMLGRGTAVVVGVRGLRPERCYCHSRRH